MRADVCILIRNYPADKMIALRRVLQSFGLTGELLTMAQLMSLGGGSSQGAKTFLNQNYQAVLYLEDRMTTEGGGIDQAYSWLPYSAGDIPIAYFGFQAHRSGVPSDVPVVPFNLSDSATYWNPHSGWMDPEQRGKYLGTRALFKDGKKVWGRFYHYRWGSGSFGSEYGLWRIDSSKLDQNREVVIWLDPVEFPTVPSDVCLGVRYYNRYLLPALGGRGWFLGYIAGDFYEMLSFGFGLVVWFLKEVGLTPRWVQPVGLDWDHPFEYPVLPIRVEEWMYKSRLTTEWLLDWARARRATIQVGVPSGGRWRGGQTYASHWHHKDLTPDSQAVHAILVAEHSATFPACWHDHTYIVGRTGGVYTRHVGGRYGYPADLRPFGRNMSASNFNLTHRTAYRVHYEGQVIEMQAMGWPDVHCGQHRYTNFAANAWANLGFLDFLFEETPIRAVRIRCLPTTTGILHKNHFYGRDMRTLRYRGIEILEVISLNGLGTRGLINPGSRRGIDYDLNQYFDLGVPPDPTPENLALCRRRYLAYRIDQVIARWLLVGSIPYIGNVQTHAALASAPLSEFHKTGNWNGMKECCEALDEWVQLLAGWWQWGSVSDVVAWRKRLRRF